jgi:hypothetical protein
MLIDRERLTRDIGAAARQSFTELLARHGHEAFYAFVLYTDGDCWTVSPAANSLEQLKARATAEEVTDSREIAAAKWSSADWAYEAVGAEPFDPICVRLQAHSNALPDEPGTFAAFKEEVHRAMVEALRSLDESGVFGRHREGAVLFITSSDNGDAEALEDRSARLLNPPDIYEAFRRRYDVDG